MSRYGILIGILIVLKVIYFVSRYESNDSGDTDEIRIFYNENAKSYDQIDSAFVNLNNNYFTQDKPISELKAEYQKFLKLIVSKRKKLMASNVPDKAHCDQLFDQFKNVFKTYEASAKQLFSSLLKFQKNDDIDAYEKALKLCETNIEKASREFLKVRNRLKKRHKLIMENAS